MLRQHSILQLIYLDTKSKDIFHQRPLLTSNDLLYDSTGKGKPIYISWNVLKDIKINNEIPLLYGHKKRLKMGIIKNFNYDARNKTLLGDLIVSQRYNAFVLDKFSEGVNGISVEFTSLEKNQRYFDQILQLTLEAVAIVDRPSCHSCKI